MAKCFYFWAECMKRANTECTCCGGQNPSDTRHGISLYGEAESDWIRSRPDIPYIKEFFLSGDENYLNVRWVADYTYGSDIDLSIECELQGNSYQQCLPSPYKQRPGQGSCSVSDPGYDLNGKNYISCEVYNTEHPNFRNINTTQFEPIDFEWNTIDFDAILGVVGVKVSIPVYITNKGFLPDSYKVAFNVINHPENVHFEKTEYTTEIITSGEITSINANIIVTSEEGFTVDICVSSLTNPQKNECKTVKIKGALSNLPDLDNYAILQILILSAFVMLYLRIYKK